MIKSDRPVDSAHWIVLDSRPIDFITLNHTLLSERSWFKVLNPFSKNMLDLWTLYSLYHFLVLSHFFLFFHLNRHLYSNPCDEDHAHNNCDDTPAFFMQPLILRYYICRPMLVRL